MRWRIRHFEGSYWPQRLWWGLFWRNIPGDAPYARSTAKVYAGSGSWEGVRAHTLVDATEWLEQHQEDRKIPDRLSEVESADWGSGAAGRYRILRQGHIYYPLRRDLFGKWRFVGAACIGILINRRGCGTMGYPARQGRQYGKSKAQAVRILANYWQNRDKPSEREGSDDV